MPFAMVAKTKGGADVLARMEIDMPQAGADEVLVRHEAIGVNFIDIYIREGAYPWPVEENLILGSEGCGIVEAVGEGVDGIAVGDRVAYAQPNGAYATHRVIAAAMVVRVPDAIASDVAAATMLKGLTVAYLVNRSYQVKPGNVVLFHAAAGGVGLLAGQWLKSLGATVIGTAGGAEKCALAAANGYDHVIDYRTQDFAAEIDRITDGVGVDVVYDSVGNDTMAKSLTATRRHGTVVNFGQSSGPYTDFQIKDLAIGSLYLTRPTLFHFTAERAWLEAASADMFERIASGSLSVAINQHVPLDDVAGAHRALAGRQTTGCTVLTV
ncbi:MAG: quinone oxidoreductase [Alphaproteobacteria bacterium]